MNGERPPAEDDPHLSGQTSHEDASDEYAESSAESAVTEALRGHRPEASQPLQCANHPDRLTFVRCSNCGKPICPDCMVYSPVGIKCAECAKMPRSAVISLKPARAARAVGAAVLVGTGVGFAYYWILSMGGFFFFLWFAGIIIGAVVGEAVLRASAHYRDRSTALIAIGGTIWAFLFPPLVWVVAQTGPSWDAVVFSVSRGAFANIFAMLVAAFVAYQRTR